MVPKSPTLSRRASRAQGRGDGTADSPQTDRLGVTWGVPELGSTVTEIGHR